MKNLKKEKEFEIGFLAGFVSTAVGVLAIMWLKNKIEKEKTQQTQVAGNDLVAMGVRG